MSSPFVAPSVFDGLRAQPVLLLRGAERQGLERWELDALIRPLHPVPAAAGEASIGTLAPLDGSYDWVVTGVCMATDPVAQRRWLTAGPTIEAVCGLDQAARLAATVGARLLVWIVDQEYRNAADDAALALEVGAAVERFVLERHPLAQPRRTSHETIRGELYARWSASDVAARYPRGVRGPNGVQRASLWTETQFLACVASMIVDPGRALIVVDHDQLRAAVAAHVLQPTSNALIYVPVPQLGWSSPRQSQAGRWIAAALDEPRRMHRAAADVRLHIDEPMPVPTGWNRDAAREVAWYLTGDAAYASPGARIDLDACLAHRRTQGSPA